MYYMTYKRDATNSETAIIQAQRKEKHALNDANYTDSRFR